MASKLNEKNMKNKNEDLDKSITIKAVSNIFETTYEKVLKIINEVKDFIKNASNSSQKLIDELDWVIKVIANKSLYSYEVNKDKLSLRNSKYSEFINFVTKYNEEVLEMNKKHILVSSLFGIGAKAQILLKPSLILKKILPDELKKMNYQEEKEKKERKKNSINVIGNVILKLYYNGLERQKKEQEEKEKKEKEKKEKEKENDDKSKNEKKIKSYESDKRLLSKGHENKYSSVNERKLEKRYKKMFTAKHNIKKIDISDTEKLNSVDLKNRIKVKNTETNANMIHNQKKNQNANKLTLTNFKKAMANYYITQVSLFDSKIEKKNLSSSKLGNKVYKSNDENKEDFIHINKIDRNKNKNKICLKKTRTLTNNNSVNICKTENNQKLEINKKIEENKNLKEKKEIGVNKNNEANKKIEANKNIEVIKNIEVNKNIEEKKEIIHINSLIEKYFNEVKNIIDKDFNIFNFKKLVGHRNVLPIIGHTLLKTLGLLDSRIISQKKLDSFLYTVSDSYKESTLYHNSLHGSDVAQSLCIYFINSNAEEVLETTVLDLLGMIVSAMGHDLGHPGFNNIFHINSSSDLAITYNDISCLENFHVSFLFKILRKEENNIFERFSTQNYKTIRKRMINQILATDMAHHGEVVSLIRTKIKASEDEGQKSFQLLSGNEKTKFEEQQILLNYMIHAADLGHNTKKFEISLQWVSLLSEEFWQQGDAEKSKGIPISFLCDRDKIDVPRSQVGFLKGFILTTFDCMVSMFPNLKYTMENTKNNIKEWQKLLDQHRLRGWTPKKEIKNEKNNEKKNKNK